MTSILKRFRADVLEMPAYVSARSLYDMDGDITFLDANECDYEPYIGAQNLSHYPSQQPKKMLEAMCRLYDVSSRNLIITRGADEAIDVLIRSTCRAGQDNIIICPPTFPMYEQNATLQGAHVLRASLKADFLLDCHAIKQAATENTKLIFICAPNNPTASPVSLSDIADLCMHFSTQSFVVVDETYIEYANTPSCTAFIEKYPNLIVLRTLSKAYAAAGLRCGVAIAQADIIAVMRKVLAPYPVPQPVAKELLTILQDKNLQRLAEKRAETIIRRDQFMADLKNIPIVQKIYPSAANFVLIKVDDATELCDRCRKSGVLLRNQSQQAGLNNCVRIAIGSDESMSKLLTIMRGEEVPQVKNQRTAKITRVTNETSIDIAINLDQAGPINIQTGIGFYDHMLEQIAKHAGFSLTLECAGDLHIDPHHSIEDCAIALGAALKQALGDKRGIGRYGFVVPMDEAEAACSIDLSNRFFLKFEGVFPEPFVGDLPTDLVEHIFRSLAENLGATLHIKVTGENTHHMVEACFKAFGRSLRQAISVTGNDLPSSKGVL